MLKKQLFIALFLYVHCVVAQEKQVDAYIKSLDSLVAHWDQQAHWSKVDSFQIENLSSKRAHLKMYYENQKLRKIVLRGGGTTYELEKCFYLENDSLLYAQEQHIQYLKTLQGETYSTNKDEVELYKTQSYFRAHRLLHQIDNTIHGNPTFSEEYLKATGESILDELNLLRALVDDTD